MASAKISALAALASPAAGDYLPVVDISEPDDADKNKRVLMSVLRDFVLSQVTLTEAVSAGVVEKAMTWPTAYAVAPSVAPIASFYSTTGADDPVFCAVKPGSVSTTGCTVVFSHSGHSGGFVTLVLPG